MPTYYPINETAARRAKEMNSHFNYEPGSATAAYRQEVDKAAAIAEAQKARVDPMYHEKIDRLLDTYARKLAENPCGGCRQRKGPLCPAPCDSPDAGTGFRDRRTDLLHDGRRRLP